MVDQHKARRGKVVWGAALVTFLAGVPCALSQGANDYLTNLGWLPARLTGDPDFLSHMSFLWGDFSLAIGALLMSLFVGWVWGGRKAAEELAQGSDFFSRTSGMWIFMIRFFIPAVVFVILLNLFGLFD
jgi:NSS family neurotransmitter:Na+ symporter